MTDYASNQTPRFLIPVRDAKDFMRGVAEEEFIWRKLYEQGSWGGHLHRALLHIAVSGMPEEDEVDVVPIYITEYLKAPKTFGLDEISAEWAERDATRSITYAVESVNEEMGEGNGTVADLEDALAYTTQAELEGGILASFDPETRDRIQDKYFYWRNSLTGERREPVKYPEYQGSPIPNPEN